MSDLPPVGELVQITLVGGSKHLAWWDDGCWSMPDGACSPAAVESWCRVLVLPDTDELTDRVAAAHRDMPWDEWRLFAARDPELAYHYRQLVRGYVAAVRGAAIR